jgi:Arc/MetJ-type ribon-helix-helix transcriptional regulator
MAVVPLRLAEEDLKALDALVNSGLYRNRSEAARTLIRHGAKVQVAEVMNVTDLVRKLLAARRRGRPPFTLRYKGKTAVQLVAEGRGD